MYFITTKRMLEVCFSAHPNIQYRTLFLKRHYIGAQQTDPMVTGPALSSLFMIL